MLRERDIWNSVTSLVKLFAQQVFKAGPLGIEVLQGFRSMSMWRYHILFRSERIETYDRFDLSCVEKFCPFEKLSTYKFL